MLVASPYSLFDDGMEFEVDTTLGGVSASNQFELRLRAGATYDYEVNWGDGTKESFNNDSHRLHTYSTPGIYKIKISGAFAGTNYSSSTEAKKIIKINHLRITEGTSLSYAFSGGTNIASLERANIDNVTLLEGCFAGVSKVVYSSLDTKNVISFTNAFSENWKGGDTPSPFPLLDFSNAENLQRAWFATLFNSFPLLNITKVKTFEGAWSSADVSNSQVPGAFPVGFFDNWNPAGGPSNKCFLESWDHWGTGMCKENVENILVSIDASGVNAPGGATAGDNYIEIDYNVATGALSAATNTAITNLKGKGWQPFINGVLV